MIGHNNFPSYRPRRSYRRHYWALFVFFVFCLWQSGAVTPGRTTDPEAASEPLAQRTSQGTVEVTTEQESLLNLETTTHELHLEPAQVVDLEAPYHISSPIPSDQVPGTPGRYAGLSAESKPASKTKLIFGEDVEEQDLDDIDRIGNHRDETVEHASKLTHPDDDDGDMSDADLTTFPKDNQIRIADIKGDSVNKEEVKDDAKYLAQPKGFGEKQSAIENSKEQTPWSKDYVFPSWDACQEVKEKADGLPDLLHVPFEVSVRDVVLEGWEDEWIAKARYSGPKLQEPKIDFVYNCE
jgi:hypothetical protein